MEEGIAGQFVRARLEARPLPHYPGTIPADIHAAYRCQETAIALWPERIGGWKSTGPLPPHLRAQCGDERLIGPAFAPSIRRAETGQIVECPVFAGGLAVFEPEIVVLLGGDAPRDKLDWTVEEATEMVADLCIGIEVASSPLSTLLKLGVTAIASDFCANFGIVIGSSIRDWRTREQISAEAFIDEGSVGRGTTSLRDGPLAALAFTLARCAERGRPLQAGAAVTTGTITFAHHVRPGQSSRFVFDGIGDVRCRAVEARAHPHASIPRAQ